MYNMNSLWEIVNKVLPTVYDDTLSYYELLCKVVDALQKISKATTEALGDLNTDLTDAQHEIDLLKVTDLDLRRSIATLQGYVDHYFDNLDVQQEINNKLDEMVSDGTIAEVLSPALDDATDRIGKVSVAYGKLLSSVAKIGREDMGSIIKTAGGLRLVAVGNSITYGAGSTQRLTWADRIADDLRNVCRTLGLTFEYTNMAIGGSVLAQTMQDDFYPATLGRDLPWAQEGKSWKQSIHDKNPNMIIVSFGMNDGGGLSNTLTAGTFYQELLSFHNEFSTGCIINYLNDIAPKDTTSKNTSDIFYRNKVSLAQEMRDFANTNRTINFFDSFRLSHLLQFGVDEKAYTIENYSVTDSAIHPFYNGTIKISYKVPPAEETSAADIYIRQYNGTKKLVLRAVDGAQRVVKLYLYNTSQTGQTLATFNVDSLSNIVITFDNNSITVNGDTRFFINSGYYINTDIQVKSTAYDYIGSIDVVSTPYVKYSGITGTAENAIAGLYADARHPTALGQSDMLYAAISNLPNIIYNQLRNA